MENLKNNLEKVIQEYVYLFTKKHDLIFDGWVADVSGTIGLFSDFYFNFEDIRLDLETDQPKDKIFDWYESMLECENPINYTNWIKIKKTTTNK